MKKQQKGMPPIGQRQLAAYLGVSQSRLSLSKSGEGENTTLGEAATQKLGLLLKEHWQARKPGRSAALIKIKEQESLVCNNTAEKMLFENNYLANKIPFLEKRLAIMKEQYQEFSDWLDTVERLLSSLADAPEVARDRSWLLNQQVDTMKKLKKTGIAAQLKLQMDIEMERARFMIYLNGRQELLRQMKG